MRVHHSSGLTMLPIFRSVAWLGMSPLLVTLWLGGCPSPHPTLQITDQTSYAGGTLQIIGTGFNVNDPVVVKIENVPGIGTWSSSAGKTTATGGKLPPGSIDVSVSYSLNLYSTLPGCRSGNSPDYYTTISVTATASEDDGSSYGTPATPLQIVNCGWTTPKVTAHQ